MAPPFQRPRCASHHLREERHSTERAGRARHSLARLPEEAETQGRQPRSPLPAACRYAPANRKSSNQYAYPPSLSICRLPPASSRTSSGQSAGLFASRLWKLAVATSSRHRTQRKGPFANTCFCPLAHQCGDVKGCSVGTRCRVGIGLVTKALAASIAPVTPVGFLKAEHRPRNWNRRFRCHLHKVPGARRVRASLLKRFRRCHQRRRPQPEPP